VPWHCPHCAARLEAASLEGAVPCPWCGSIVYAEEGDGIPHRIVSSCRSETEIRRTALDCFRRRGSPGEPGRLGVVYVPYYVFESTAGAGPWTGTAAVGLPSADLVTIPIYGTDTRWFDPAALPEGANVMEASRSLESAAEGRTVVELRHVPIALVSYEERGEPGSLWIDADRGRVLAGGPRRTDSVGARRAFPRALWGAAGAAGFCGLVLPPPWSIWGAAGSAIAFMLAGSGQRRRAARAAR